MKLYEINRYAYSVIDKNLLEGNEISFFYDKLYDDFICFVEKPESKCRDIVVGYDKTTKQPIYRGELPGFSSFSGQRIQNLLLRFVKELAKKEGYSPDSRFVGEPTNLEKILKKGYIFRVSSDSFNLDDNVYVGELSILDKHGNMVPQKYMSSTYGVEDLFVDAEKGLSGNGSGSSENAKKEKI